MFVNYRVRTTNYIGTGTDEGINKSRCFRGSITHPTYLCIVFVLRKSKSRSPVRYVCTNLLCKLLGVCYYPTFYALYSSQRHYVEKYVISFRIIVQVNLQSRQFGLTLLLNNYTRSLKILRKVLFKSIYANFNSFLCVF